ncbi:12317_t:CDS:2 [Entrophospora sp. SA101]|nr:12317_t:CDS:2 [Entrophospora sp. SA101]
MSGWIEHGYFERFIYLLANIAKLEHNDKNIATENDELKSRVAKLEQQQLQNNSSDNIDTPEQINLQSDESKTRGYATYTPVSDVSDISSNSVDLNDTPNSDKVEQGLIRELFELIRSIDIKTLQNPKKIPLNSIFIEQISNIPVDVDLTPGSVAHLASLFGKAEKLDEKKICDGIIIVKKNVDAISSLTSTQVQNIIKVYTNELVKSQIDYTDLGKLPETEIDASSSDIKESLPETEVSGLSEKVSDETNINIPPINKDTSNESRLPISILPDDPEKNGIMLLKWYWTDFLVYH